MIRRGDDSGAGVVWVLIAIAALLSVATWQLASSTVAAARARASAAADLAALAGAERAVLGEREACDRAETVAAVNRGEVRSCEVDTAGRTVEVVVEVALPGALAHLSAVRVRARAGPDPR